MKRLTQNAISDNSVRFRTLACTQDRVPDAVNARRSAWGISSAGRAPAWHAGGQEFESPILHQPDARRTPGRRGAQAPRNVRAPSGRVQDNVLSGRLEGKCHRNIPPFGFARLSLTKADGKGEIVR